MQVQMQRGESSTAIDSQHWDLAITGPRVDDRGHVSAAYVEKHSTAVCSMAYDVERIRLTIDGQALECDELPEWIASTRAETIVLEATTLGLPEIALCCRAASNNRLNALSILYVEPRQYYLPRPDTSVLRRDFQLSAEIDGFSAIPGSAFLLDEMRNQQVVFFLGYEGHRLDRAFEQLPLVPERCSVVFGVPAFQPGWEMDAFANNIQILRERSIEGGVAYCGADNPGAAFDLLSERYANSPFGEQLFVAPIGTKPHGIGAAVFACLYPDVGLLYDHPRRSEKRSSEVAQWHLFRVELSAPQ